MKMTRTAPILGLTTLTALFLTAALPRQAAAQFTITAPNIGGTAPSASANQDVQAALNTLAANFSTNGTSAFNLVANISWADEGTSTLGSSFAGSGDYQTVTGAQVNDAVDPTVLVNNDLDRYLFGAASTVNTGGSYADFTIVLNNNASIIWDYTQATPSNFNSYSLASVITHEALHSMGFSAFNNPDGSYFLQSNGGAGIAAPSIWDTKMYDGLANQGFTSPDETNAERATVMTSGADANASGTIQDGAGAKLFFTGANAEKANGGKPVELFAPHTFQDGSSDGSHLGPDLSDPAPDLLNPALFNGSYLTASPLDLAALTDIGWKLSPAAVPEASTTISFGLLLALGLGSMVIANKRKAVSNPV